MSHQESEQRELEQWRTGVAVAYLTVVSVSAPVVLLAWWLLGAAEPPYRASLYIGASWLGFLAARLFAPRRLQAVLAVVLLLVVGLLGVATLGLLAGPFVAVLSGLVVGAIVLGRRAAALLLGASAAVILLIGWAYASGSLGSGALLDQRAFSTWLRTTAFFAVGAGLLLYVVTALFARLLEAWTSTAEAAERERVEYQHRLEAEARAAESARLEAVGRLAGGVAHDFNNLLVVIMTWAELLKSVGPEERAEGLEAISRASAQAAELVRQLLTYAGKNVRQPTAVDVDAFVAATLPSLRRLAPDDVRIEFQPQQLPPVLVAEGELGQVLLNLFGNARDALPTGGTISVSTALLGPGGLPAHAPDPGARYVALRVADTGLGMDEATRQRVFEPFFSTKGPGRGTGLGLASVQGIASAAGGWVELSSAPGKGSTFTVAFPVAPQEVGPVASQAAAAPAPDGRRRRILLVEDEPRVRASMAAALRSAGIEAVEAGNVEEALEVARTADRPLELLCTDGVMPGLPTQQLIDGFRARFPAAPVLVCSGHVEEELVVRGLQHGQVAALPKPFTAAQLVERIKGLLPAA